MRDGQKSKLARRLRREGNLPETTAWNALRTLRSQGVVVRRQHPIGPYIVDFAIVSRNLVIEVDGGIHMVEEVAERDAERALAITALGWRVIRISSETALSADHLLNFIQRELGL